MWSRAPQSFCIQEIIPFKWQFMVPFENYVTAAWWHCSPCKRLLFHSVVHCCLRLYKFQARSKDEHNCIPDEHYLQTLLAVSAPFPCYEFILLHVCNTECCFTCCHAAVKNTWNHTSSFKCTSLHYMRVKPNCVLWTWLPTQVLESVWHSFVFP